MAGGQLRKYNRRPLTRKSKKKPTIGKKVLRVMKNKGLLPEVKFYDTIVAEACTQAGTQTNLVYLIAQGTGDNNRIGNKIKVFGVDIQYTLLNGSTAGASDLITTYLIQDKQYNGSAPTIIGAINTDTTAVFNGLTGAVPYGGEIKRNPDEKDRFMVRLFKRHVCNGAPYWNGSAELLERQHHNTHAYVNFKQPIEVSYTANTGAITNVATNALLFGAASYNNGTTSIIWYCRVYYTDV